MYAFIGGIPASGKSTLAKAIAKELNREIPLIGTDEIRDTLLSIPKYEKWVNIYWNMDEKEFMTTKTCEEKMSILVSQSEALFPPILDFFKEEMSKHDEIIFEGVTILPHLARKYFDFEGIFLLHNNKDEIVRRLEEDNRWGSTQELHKLEADHFIDCEAKFIEEEAKKHGYPVFDDFEEAKNQLIKLLE